MSGGTDKLAPFKINNEYLTSFSESAVTIVPFDWIKFLHKTLQSSRN